MVTKSECTSCNDPLGEYYDHQIKLCASHQRYKDRFPTDYCDCGAYLGFIYPHKCKKCGIKW